MTVSPTLQTSAACLPQQEEGSEPQLFSQKSPQGQSKQALNNHFTGVNSFLEKAGIELIQNQMSPSKKDPSNKGMSTITSTRPGAQGIGNINKEGLMFTLAHKEAYEKFLNVTRTNKEQVLKTANKTVK